MEIETVEIIYSTREKPKTERTKVNSEVYTLFIGVIY